MRYDRKLVSDNNEGCRNTKVSKTIKQKYGLTFSEGKKKVKTEMLHGPEDTSSDPYKNDLLPPRPKKTEHPGIARSLYPVLLGSLSVCLPSVTPSHAAPELSLSTRPQRYRLSGASDKAIQAPSPGGLAYSPDNQWLVANGEKGKEWGKHHKPEKAAVSVVRSDCFCYVCISYLRL